MSDQITLRCPMCPAQTLVARQPADPPAAAVLELLCDKHRSGDYVGKLKYFDDNGDEVSA